MMRLDFYMKLENDLKAVMLVRDALQNLLLSLRTLGRD